MSHQPGETDITGVLIGVFVVMIGVLIATTTQNFISQSTSTSSRAAAPAPKTSGTKTIADIKADQSCQTNFPFGLQNSPTYTNEHGTVLINDYCPTVDNWNFWIGITTGCVTNYTKDNTTKCGGSQSCCRLTSELADLGDKQCQTLYNDNSAACEASCGSSYTPLNGKGRCGYVSGSQFNEGVCCSGIHTFAPTVTPMPANTVRNCGTRGIDCMQTWGVSMNLNSASNQKNGKILQPTCIQDPITNDYVCGLTLPAGDTTCDGKQYAYGVYGLWGTGAVTYNNGACFTTMPTSSGGQETLRDGSGNAVCKLLYVNPNAQMTITQCQDSMK